MKWYYKILGDHTRVLVFTNGALNGVLVFSNEEFEDVRQKQDGGYLVINFIEEISVKTP